VFDVFVLTRLFIIIYLFIYCLPEITMRHSHVSKHEDSETNIIVHNTALKYKIQRNTHTQKHKHTKEPVQKPERSIAPKERLKAFTVEKLVISHVKL